jgi:hypothetical protein
MNHRGNDFQHVNVRILILKCNFFLIQKRKTWFFSDRIGMEINDRIYNSDSRRSSIDSISRNHLPPYSIITGPKNSNEFVDCQIIIVNVRQRFSIKIKP